MDHQLFAASRHVERGNSLADATVSAAPHKRHREAAAAAGGPGELDCSGAFLVGGVQQALAATTTTTTTMAPCETPVVGQTNNSLAVVDVTALSSRATPSTYRRREVALSPDGAYAYVTGCNADAVAVVNVTLKGSPEVVSGVVDAFPWAARRGCGLAGWQLHLRDQQR